MRLRSLDNRARSLGATEYAEHIPARTSKVFGHSEGSGRFGQTKFQNFPHECGNEVRSRLVS
jgi:hypothetical protein